MADFKNRIIRAMKLDVSLYEEVEKDKQALPQAMAVVIISSIAAGIGAGMKAGIGGIVVGTIAALIVWYIWAYLIFLIGTKLLPGPQTKADIGELLRTIGFARSAGLICILGVIPGLTEIVFLAAAIWILVATVIAVRQALDYSSTLRAVGVCVVGWIIQVVIFIFLLSLVGGLNPKG